LINPEKVMDRKLPETLYKPVAHVGSAKYRRIATEEAWAPAEILDRFRALAASRKLDDPGFNSMFGFYLTSPSPRSQQIRDYLVNLDEQRIAHMDERGIDIQILSLTAPGVQVFDRDLAVSLAANSNDMLSEAVRRHPDRLAGLAAIAPQDPAAAAKELERGVKVLGLKGAIINSRTFNEYLDDSKFWPILEAAEALDVPIYLHPQTPPASMVGPLLERGLDGAIFGFAVETGMHLLRIIISGAFDRFPNLKFVAGHLGEGLPFWMYRLDYMHRASVLSRRYESMKPLKMKISDYLRRNVYVTTSGMPWEPSIRFCQNVLGVDRVLYAMDYPYEHDIEEVVATDNMDMSDHDKASFFQKNAETVFKLNT
jgi:5-carboxyvanillate decarboxylase